MLELEVKTVSTRFLFDLYAFLLSVMLQNKLLKEQECSFVLNQLSYLNLSLPQMRGIGFLTIVTLKIGNNVINDERLLQVRT